MSHDEYPTVNERMAEQMTHDELLAEIGYNAERTSNALRAVVKLHKPIGTTSLVCKHCDSFSNEYAYSVVFPCPTIQAIEKELG